MNKIKRLISLLLCFTFVVSCAVIPVQVHAAGAASVNGVEYATLQEAFDAASAGDTVTLISDVVLDAPLSVTKNVILSGDGSYGVSRSADLSASPITVEAGATLTLFAVTVNGSGSAALTPFISVDGGTLNARDGVSFTGCYSSSNGGAVRVNAGICDLSGASFSNNSAMSGSAVYVSANASAIRISGSTSFGAGDNIYLAAGKYIEITKDLTGSGNITVQSAVVEEGTRIALIADASIVLSDEQAARFVVESDDGEKATALSGDSIVIGVAPTTTKVARIGDKEFDSLEDAFAAVTDGSVVELLCDVELKREIVVKNANVTLISSGSHTVSRASSLKVGYMFNVVSGAGLTVGGSGDPITLSGASVSATMPAIYCGGSVVLSSGVTVTANKNVNPNLFYQGSVFVPEGGSLVINGASITSNTNTAGAVMVYGGTLTMNSGSVSSNTAENGGGVYIKSGTFNMKGGSISGNTASVNGGAIYCAGVLKLAGNASIPGGTDSKNDIYLTGGRSITAEAGWNPGTAVAALTPTDTVEGTKLVYFASAAEAKPEYFVFTGELAKKAKPRAKDNYVFVGPLTDEAYVAYIGPTAYTSLVEAINAVPADSSAVTVTIVSDVMLGGTVVIPENKNIIFTTGVDPVSNASPEYTARTFKREGSFDGAMFSVAANARLQIAPAQGKQIVFDGSGAVASNSVFVVLGTLEFQEGAIVRGNSNKKNEALTSAVPVFPVGGAVTVGVSGVFTMNGGSLEGNYASKGGAVFVSDGVFNLNGGTITGNSAVYGGAVMLFNATTTDNVTVKETAQTNTPANTPATVPEKHGYMTMLGGTITNNSAPANSAYSYANGQGGAIYIGNAATLEALGGSISGNKAGTGAGIYVGTIREKGEKALRVPVFLLAGGFRISADNDVYLTLVNESVITVTGSLTGLSKSNPMVVTLPGLLAQNSALVRFRIASNNDEQNRMAAGAAVTSELFRLTGETDQFYNIAQSSLDRTVLLNVIPNEEYLTYLSGRHYNGVPAYEEVLVEGQEQPVKNRLVYEPVKVSHDGCFTYSFEMSYYVNLYSNLHTQLVAALPAGTKITLIDTSNPEKPQYYYYEVTGKETIRKPEVELNLTAEDDKPLDLYEIPLEDFLVMGEDKLNYGEAEEEKPSAEKAAVKTERFTFVVDFENAKVGEKVIFDGGYTLAVEHNYPGETEGSYHNISENFAVVEYNVTDENTSEVTVESAGNKLNVSYKLDKSGRIASVGRGLVLIERVDDVFPAGTVVKVNNTVYPVSSDSGKISVPIPLSKSGELVEEGSITLEFSNYYGSAVLEAPVRAVIYPSYDGLHVTTGSNPDAESEGVNFALEALDSYAVAVTGADGKKPVYEFESAAKAETLLMTVNALRNGETAEKVTLTLQNAKDDYAEVPLSTLFVGYDKVDSEGIEIVVGACSLKLKDAAPNGEYRMAFTVGDKTEYVKITIGK